MTKSKRESLVKLLKELKEEHTPKMGSRSTVTDCTDFLLAVLGVKI